MPILFQVLPWSDLYLLWGLCYLKKNPDRIFLAIFYEERRSKMLVLNFTEVGNPL